LSDFRILKEFNKIFHFILQIQQNSPSFCATYECNNEDTHEEWGIGFEACVCPKKFVNEEPDNNNFKRCCNYGVTVKDGFKLVCPQEEIKGTHCKKCTGRTIHDIVASSVADNFIILQNLGLKNK
jgi:hypothetical protein